MTVHTPARPIRSTGWGGWVPFALVALVLIPAIAGSLRLVELAGGPHVMPANRRITASPLWMTPFYIRRHGRRPTTSRRMITAIALVGSS